MKLDFTRKKYIDLLKKLKYGRWKFLTYSEYCKGSYDGCFVILRHDVDMLPGHSLEIARIEHDMGIKATYYFRTVPQSWDERVIREIASLGHEVGYHYESLTTCKGNISDSYSDFCANLNKLRSIVPVNTICMHGSPRSPFDSRKIWDMYDYRTLGIIGEPYLDTDWSKVFYLTDTGRCWDGYKVSVRDKIVSWQDRWNTQGLSFHSTDDIILSQLLPSQIMITTHPQRWNELGIGWIYELFMQNIKNMVKGMIVRHFQ